MRIGGRFRGPLGMSAHRRLKDRSGSGPKRGPPPRLLATTVRHVSQKVAPCSLDPLTTPCTVFYTVVQQTALAMRAMGGASV